ncbi:MAG TPA: glycosyltransferase, partial [Rhodopila sp.]|nr:glycosyltransferase [Rhodopila sp.]
MDAEAAKGAAGQSSDIESLARLALNEGQAALLAQNNAAALRWLDRAHRLVPADPNVVLALASACVGDDPERAEALFRQTAEAHDVGQAWLGLAAARLRKGDAGGVLAPLVQVLSTHALTADTIGLVDRLAAETGWCGLHSDGRIEVHLPTASRGEPVIRLDGRKVAGRCLPPDWHLARRLEIDVDGTPLPGSPVRIDAVRRLTGCVEAVEGGITGWAWHPNDPATDPVLTLRWPESGQERRLVADEPGRQVPHCGPLAQPRGFTVMPADMPADSGLLHILGEDGRHLLGSPLDPFAEMNGHTAAALALARVHAVGQVNDPEGAASTRRPTPPEDSPSWPVSTGPSPSAADTIRSQASRQGMARSSRTGVDSRQKRDVPVYPVMVAGGPPSTPLSPPAPPGVDGGPPATMTMKHQNRLMSAPAWSRLPMTDDGAGRPETPLIRHAGAVPLLADALIPATPFGADSRKRPVTVIVPVHDGGAVVRASLRSLLATIGGARILVIDDGSRDPETIAHLDDLAKSRRIRLLRHAIAQGFPAAANAGMRAARGRDVVLLNSDTLLPADWLERLRAAAYAGRDIGTVTPLSNNASILSYPAKAGGNPCP